MLNKERFKELLGKREVKEGKDGNLEKGDFLALVLAAFSVFMPAILLFCAGLGIFIWLFLLYIH